jgi:hypothetical protein
VASITYQSRFTSAGLAEKVFMNASDCRRRRMGSSAVEDASSARRPEAVVHLRSGGGLSRMDAVKSLQ